MQNGFVVFMVFMGFQRVADSPLAKRQHARTHGGSTILLNQFELRNPRVWVTPNFSILRVSNKDGVDFVFWGRSAGSLYFHRL